jgi:S-DNA-T family DNA segregation ATPase FtsK/SpoIIIE
MTKTSKKETTKKTESTENRNFWKLSRQQKMLFGSLLVLFSVALLF